MNAVRMLAVLLAWNFAAFGFAQDYPVKPVRIITSTPGNFHDIVSRKIAGILTERWRQPVVVENRGGAGATLAATAVAQAPADGYTLLVTDRTGLTVSPTLMRNLSYDPFRDLAPISLVAAAPMILAAHPSVPAETMREFVAYLQAASQTHLASAGPATGTHLLGEVLKQVTGANVVNVHYKGTPAALTGLLAGDTQAGFILVPVALPHISSGRIKAYATTGRNRFAGAPSIPTMSELGIKELESELWLAIMAPSRTPEAIVNKVNRDVVEILKNPAVREFLQAQGAEPLHSTPAELAAYMRTETERWRRVIQSAAIRIE